MLQPTFDSPLATCNLCNSPDIQLYTVDYKGIQIYQCKRCNVQFMNPQYTEHYLEEFYKAYPTLDAKHHLYEKAEYLREYLHEKNISDIERFTHPGRFLSVGCGSAHDLVVAKRKGWKAEGFEVDEPYAQQISEKIGIPIRSGDFITMEYAHNAFDCIYMNHVIEHPKDPSAYLNRCHDLLKPDGILYMACPNIKSLSGKMKKLLETLHMKGKKGSYYDTWHHLFFYSPSVMKRLLRDYYGFEVLLLGNDRKFKPGQSALSKKMANSLAYVYPFKASFRVIAKKV